MIVVGILLIAGGILLGLWGLFDTWDGEAQMGLGMLAVIVGLILCAITHSSSKKVEQNTTSNQAEVQAADNTQTAANNATTDAQPAQQQSDQAPDKLNKDGYYDKFPRNKPSDDKELVKWWHDWAVYNTDGDPVVCRDGVQVVVSGLGSNDGGATSISTRTRVHPDGKPFTCEESKDPTEELKS